MHGLYKRTVKKVQLFLLTNANKEQSINRSLCNVYIVFTPTFGIQSPIVLTQY